MDIKCNAMRRIPAWVVTSAALLATCLAGSVSAETSCVLSGQELVAMSVENCVQLLREAPSGAAHPEMLKPVEDPFGVPGGVGTGYTEFNVGDEKFSAAFTHCIKLAAPTYDGGAVTKLELPAFDGEGKAVNRYEYTNKYQIHRLRDIKRKIVYDLIRIPEGGIEAMGTWMSDKPTITEGCKNSYGEPCGTKYIRNRAGGYERL